MWLNHRSETRKNVQRFDSISEEKQIPSTEYKFQMYNKQMCLKTEQYFLQSKISFFFVQPKP